CAQPGCTGSIADGYCDTCGMAADSPVAAADEAEPLADAASVATAASRVQSAAFGSARATHATLATRRTRTGSERMRAARLGAGLTIVQPAPPVDPTTVIIADPQVPEDK